MNCSHISTAAVCYTDGAGVPRTLIAHYTYGPNAAGDPVIAATRYTEADGSTVVDTSAGTVAAGTCPVAPPDVEWSQLCDVLANGTVVEFFRRTITSFSASGVPTTAVADFALNKTTAYVVAGTVAACNQDCDPVTPLGLLTTW